MTYAGGLLLNGRSACRKVLCAKKGYCVISDSAYNNSLAHRALCSLGKTKTGRFVSALKEPAQMGLLIWDTHLCETDKTEFKQQRLIVLKCAREQRP